MYIKGFLLLLMHNNTQLEQFEKVRQHNVFIQPNVTKLNGWIGKVTNRGSFKKLCAIQTQLKLFPESLF